MDIWACLLLARRCTGRGNRGQVAAQRRSRSLRSRKAGEQGARGKEQGVVWLHDSMGLSMIFPGNFLQNLKGECRCRSLLLQLHGSPTKFLLRSNLPITIGPWPLDGVLAANHRDTYRNSKRKCRCRSLLLRLHGYLTKFPLRIYN